MSSTVAKPMLPSGQYRSPAARRAWSSTRTSTGPAVHSSLGGTAKSGGTENGARMASDRVPSVHSTTSCSSSATATDWATMPVGRSSQGLVHRPPPVSHGRHRSSRQTQTS